MQDSGERDSGKKGLITAFLKRRQDSTDRMEGFKEKGKDLISEDYLKKGWDQIKGNKLLKIHFATWYEMKAPLVFFYTKHE